MPKKRLPAIVDRAVWEKVNSGRAGIRWDSAVEKVWEDIEEITKGVVSEENFGRFGTEVEGRIERREIRQ